MLSRVQLFATPRIAACQAPLEYVAVPSSRESSGPRDWTCVSQVSYIGRWIPYCWTIREAPWMLYRAIKQLRWWAEFFLMWWDLSWKVETLFFFLFRPQLTAFGISVPQPGIKPGTPAVEAHSLNHWTTRKVPISIFLKSALNYALKPWKLNLSIGLTFLTNLMRKFS